MVDPSCENQNNVAQIANTIGSTSAISRAVFSSACLGPYLVSKVFHHSGSDGNCTSLPNGFDEYHHHGSTHIQPQHLYLLLLRTPVYSRKVCTSDLTSRNQTFECPRKVEIVAPRQTKPDHLIISSAPHPESNSQAATSRPARLSVAYPTDSVLSPSPGASTSPPLLY